MSSPPSDVRSGLTGGEQAQVAPASASPAYGGRPLTVAVTGAAGVLGERVTARLTGSPGVRKVLAIDDRRGEAAGVQWRVLDVRDPAVAERLRGVDVVVHLAMDLNMESDPRPAAPTTFGARRPC